MGPVESGSYTHAAVPAVPSEWDPEVFTSITTSSENLNSVWELCRYTLRVAMYSDFDIILTPVTSLAHTNTVATVP